MEEGINLHRDNGLLLPHKVKSQPQCSYFAYPEHKKYNLYNFDTFFKLNTNPRIHVILLK